MKNLLSVGLAVLVLALFAVSASAGVIHDDIFNASVFPDGEVTGGGSGWNDGEFVYYPESGWYNEWFYNDPPSPLRWKWIDYDISVVPGDGLGGDIEIVINWSTLAWPETGPVGPPPGGVDSLTLPQEEMYIVRDAVIFSGPVTESLCLRSSDAGAGQIIIPDYNPEWVSIDIRLVDGTGMEGPILVNGCITHQCVPEPAALVLLGLGVVALVVRRRVR